MNLFSELQTLLQQDPRLTAEVELLKNQITELALKLDTDLLRLLISHDRLKAHFFADVNGILVFDKDKFVRFVSNKAFLPDSYTSFKNKIDLITGDRFLSENREVVLSWPYKDCVLEGGQTKENAKRDEIFWNEILAPDEIDRLLAPKVLTNFKRYDQNGVSRIVNPTNFVKENLIIKGNNLLALYILLTNFREQVRLIYIDPPFNTDRDDFTYNDSFTHSTWLTFMKNRLEIAYKLLKPDGNIVVHIDNIESHYLKILLDEIFGRDNFVNEIIWHKGREGGSSRSHSKSSSIPTEYQNIFIYAKNKPKRFWNPTLGPYKPSTISRIEKDEKGWW